MAGPKKKYDRLLNNKDLERWYNEMARSSRITADVCLRRLGSFSGEIGIEPFDMVTRDEKSITDMVSDYITLSMKKGLSGAYVLSTVKAVKSWLAYNNLKFTRKIRVPNASETVTLKDERIPTQEELKRILASGDPRARATCILMAHSGVRPEVLGSYTGEDGLIIRDVQGLKIENETVSFGNIPAMIVVRPELNKARRQYLTFIGNEGCFYLKAYLEERIREGESVTERSPIIVPSKQALRSEHSFIRTINIGDIVRMAIRKAGFPWRPYVLRSYFDTQLMLAESKGLILRDYRQFFMGHVGDMEHRYTINKQRLPEDVTENMRESYAKCLKFLETESKGIKEEDFIKTQRETAIMIMETAFGMQLDDKQKEDLLSASTEDFQKMLTELFSKQKMDTLNNGNRYKTIPESKLEEYLNKGFELVQIYPSGDKAIVRLP